MKVWEAMQKGWEEGQAMGILAGRNHLISRPDIDTIKLCALGFTYLGAFGKLPGGTQDENGYKRLAQEFPILEVADVENYHTTLQGYITRWNDRDEDDMDSIIQQTKDMEESNE